MAKELKDLTKSEENYSQWYNDLVVKAGLAENSAVRGCMVIKPYGYAIWEKMQAILDRMFKQTGHENAYFPLFIPKSFFSKEAHHVEGFAKECAVVTHYRLKNDPEGKGVVVDPDARLEEELIVRPTSETIIWNTYKNWIHSYRDLPLRVGELGIVHRHELSGALHGLFRVRCFTQDDAHIFMTPDQVKDEIKGVAKLIDDVYSLFGFKYHMELSTMPEDHIGTDEQWEVATNGLVSALNELGKPYVINEGDGAFYGPKIDFHLEDSLGRTWQCGTIQLDMQMPERFDLEYVGADGEKHRPVMIHRVCFGSIERFIGILTEHYAGAFPLWLAPVQVKVMPITDRTNNYAKHVADRLEKAGLRVETDLRNEKIGYKIREAQSQKIPYMLVLGDKEAENDTISVRTLSGEQSVEGLSDFIARLQADVKSRKS